MPPRRNADPAESCSYSIRSSTAELLELAASITNRTKSQLADEAIRAHAMAILAEDRVIFPRILAACREDACG